VVCSHPRENAWIAKDGDKCDRVDAYKLAELLRINRFKEVHHAPDQSRRDFKQLVQHCDELTAHQARWKTKLKARLRLQGVMVTGERLFSSAGRKAVMGQSRVARSAHRNQATLRSPGPERGGTSTSAHSDAKDSAGFPGDQTVTHRPGRGSDRCLSLQCLHSHAAALQFQTKTLEVFPAQYQSSQQYGKPLRRPKPDYSSGCGRLKDVSRKAFEVAQRLRTDNGFKRAYQRALETTQDETHARLTVQRKILSTMRAIWISRTPYRDELSR
jgi:hypothetical protein